MRLGDLVQHRAHDRVAVDAVGRLAGEPALVQRQGRVFHLLLRDEQVGLGAAQDLVGAEVGIERELQALVEVLLAEAELAVRARQQRLLEPDAVVLQRGDRAGARRRERGLHVGRLLDEVVEVVLHERDRALVLRDRGLGVDLGRALQVLPGGGDQLRDRLQAQFRGGQAILHRREVAREQHVDALGGRVVGDLPRVGLEHLDVEQARAQVVLEDLAVDGVVGRQAGRRDRLDHVQRLAIEPAIGGHAGGRGVAGLAVKAVVAQLRGFLRVRGEVVLVEVVHDLFEAVRGRGVGRGMRVGRGEQGERAGQREGQLGA